VLIPALDLNLSGKTSFLSSSLAVLIRVKDKFGAFLVDNAPAEPRDYARGDQNIAALWELSEKLVGEKFDV
jgi:hypothetical protein